MAVKIGSARIDENGKIAGGKAGDQTGAELSIQDYYLHSKGWYVLRAKDAAVAEKIAKCMADACANPYIGYDQNQRNTLYNAVKNNGFKCDIENLKTKVETDCSALVRVCVGYAGIKIGDVYTGNLKDVLLATGLFILVKCDMPSELRRGDILVTKKKGHVVVVLSNGSKVNASKPASSPTQTYKVESAKSKDSVGSKVLRCTTDLHLRAGAGKTKKSIMVMKSGTKVAWYGYYTLVDGTKWYLVVCNGVTGFASSKYLV